MEMAKGACSAETSVRLQNGSASIAG
jgi:hypothetical protein